MSTRFLSEFWNSVGHYHTCGTAGWDGYIIGVSNWYRKTSAYVRPVLVFSFATLAKSLKDLEFSSSTPAKWL